MLKRAVAVVAVAALAGHAHVCKERAQQLFKELEALEEFQQKVLAGDERVEHLEHFIRLLNEEIHGAKLTDDELKRVGHGLFINARPAITQELLDRLKGASFEVEKSEHFKQWARADAMKIMGTRVGANAVRLQGQPPRESWLAAEDVPASFDAREKWGAKCRSVKLIRDQSKCGSCWAFGTTTAFNDRVCIATDGGFTNLLSVAHTASCCDEEKCQSNGCNGGEVSTPWQWFADSGVVTGGDYVDLGKKDTCWPYPMQSCEHHVNGTKPNCDDVKEVALTCRATCVNKGYPTQFAQDKHKGATAYALQSVEDIKRDIFTHGPVSAAFSVYADFPAYKSGVYVHKTGAPLGGHAIRLLGWGTESGMDYWLVANSWNEDWGMKGTFKIKQGDCGINDQVNGGIPAQALLEQLMVV